MTEAALRRGTLAITGHGVLTGLGVGADALTPRAPADVVGMFDELLPSDRAHVLTDFAAAKHLGRKGTAFLDRGTAFGLVACKEALADTDAAELDPLRTGIAIGTTAGSLKSTGDYATDTLTQDRPYLVNPVLFPNAVLNSIAGQAAIRFGFQGLNATIAGGPLALLQGLNYAGLALATGRAGAMLVGAVEEYSPQRAWATYHAGHRGPYGEGAAVFVVEDAERVRGAGRRPVAEVLAAVTGRRGLGDALRDALTTAGVSTADVRTVVLCTGGPPGLDGQEEMAVDDVLGAGPDRRRITDVTGVAGSATGAFGLASVLADHQRHPDRDGWLSVLTACSADGTAGAAVVRGWSRAGDHG
jgi:3-oxoacyl-[acyl-carrier-protein] synthase II